MNKFWLGVMFTSGIITGYQDFIGLDAYIAAVRAGWVQLPAYVGFGLAGIALFLLVVETRDCFTIEVRVVRDNDEDKKLNGEV